MSMPPAPLQPLFEWMQGTALASYFLNTTWSSPIVQCIHLVALVIFAGSVLIVDVRLLGRGVTDMSIAQVARMAQPWLIWSFVVLLLSGVPQVFSTALKQYYSPFFWWKMELLILGMIFTFTIRRRVALADAARIGTFWPKVVAVFSMVLWTGVGTWARLIGLLS